MEITNPELEKEVTVMKKVFYTLGLTVVFNVAATAQKPATPADQTTDQKKIVNSSASSTKDSNSSNGSASFSTLSNVQARLQNSLDTKNVKVGDEVILRTTQSIKQNGQVVVPKGSELVGHVTEVRQRTDNGGASRLGLAFDQLKNGRSVTPITASIVSIINANSSASLDNGVLDSDLSGSGSTSTRASSGSAGGLLGGVNDTVGGLVNGTTRTVGGITNTASQTLGNTTSAVGKTIDGIQISTNVTGTAQGSTSLSSQNKDIRLEKGVTFGLNVQKAGSN